MNVNDYVKLREKAREAGLGEHPALIQLLHLLQGKHKAQDHYRAYMRDMNEWEKNCARDVEDAIRKVNRNEKTR
jgi:hypothetical protein